MQKQMVSILAVFAVLYCSCSKEIKTPPQGPEQPVLTGTPVIESRTLLSGRGIIWGFDYLPDGRLLFTEKVAGMFTLDTSTNAVMAIDGLPNNVESVGQGGWLDVCKSPGFVANRTVYVTYSITGNFLVLARFTLNGNSAENWELLHTTATPSWGGHYGSRICFGPDGKLYWAVGEGGGGTRGGAGTPYMNGQLLNTLWGKVHRMNPDGTVPADNPVIAGAPVPQSTIFSYGHRNPQGMCFSPTSSKLYLTEHGPKGGCELNLIGSGQNYGWPLYSDGVNYDDSYISDGHNAAGITAPLQSFKPALAPGGLAFINHRSFRDWNGRLLSASLGRRQLLMIRLQNDLPVSDTVLFNGIGRIRNVKQAPDGKIHFSVEDGRLMELRAR